jgi:hypothetical protein
VLIPDKAGIILIDHDFLVLHKNTLFSLHSVLIPDKAGIIFIDHDCLV